ncbi:hypothetical protein [Wolbachia endosymbiont of Mansonella perstans]|uniref:hypothetical protein n=1 Tax=Wolbachia endosymbiont of Mansonella perstans TaxID=229526 RepID=UPI001CE1DA3B|nr:hypothetical protein [Wolbachia endosymbiont of Mansonella perstans]MCA4773741.1 hypothetical protein [Wolbachia endosymbiont of Mansonella perstans]
MAKNLLKAGFSVDIIYQATGLSADKYDDKEEKVHIGSMRQNIGQKIRHWRTIRGYT